MLPTFKPLLRTSPEVSTWLNPRRKRKDNSRTTVFFWYVYGCFLIACWVIWVSSRMWRVLTGCANFEGDVMSPLPRPSPLSIWYYHSWLWAWSLPLLRSNVCPQFGVYKGVSKNWHLIVSVLQGLTKDLVVECILIHQWMNDHNEPFTNLAIHIWSTWLEYWWLRLPPVAFE